eukprot:m.8271 g.8271  ORF g.8271 m.8271 type:complete len:847 (-) comp5339_c0_seq2:2563-5103(-)
MADLDTLLQDFSYLKSLEHKNQAPSRLSSRLHLAHSSVHYAVRKHFDVSGELVFERILRRPFGTRCMATLFGSEEFIKHHGPAASLCLALLEKLKSLSAQDIESGWKRANSIYQRYLRDEVLVDIWKAHGDILPKFEHQLQQLRAVAEQDKANAAASRDQDTASQDKDTTTTSTSADVDSGPVPVGTRLVNLRDTLAPFEKPALTYLADEPWKLFLESDMFVRYCQLKHLELNMRISPSDFDVHRIIGRGGFGEVFPCRKRDTGQVFAMKKFYKKRLKAKHQELSAVHERNVLAEMNSKFVINLKYAFQDDSSLYLVLDLMQGGDLAYHLRNKKRFSLWEAQFYAAEVVLGIAHIHSRNMVYRDLKPANVLLDEHGHARISDLGLARRLDDSLPTSACGTLGYSAPEVLLPGVHYSKPADWWSLGIMIFQLLTGRTPFRQSGEGKNDADSIMRRVVEEDPKYPEDFPDAARDIVSQLLEKDPSKRLGTRGASEVRAHPFFHEIEWYALLDHKIEPAIKPIKNQVNAVDVYDIQRIQRHDIKSIKITPEENIQYYSSFHHIMSHQWQTEILDSVYDNMVAASEQTEAIVASIQRKFVELSDSERGYDLAKAIMQGYVMKQSGFFKMWSQRYLILTPEMLCWTSHPLLPVSKTIPFQDIVALETDPRVNKFYISFADKLGRMFKFQCMYQSDFDIWTTEIQAKLPHIKAQYRRQSKTDAQEASSASHDKSEASSSTVESTPQQSHQRATTPTQDAVTPSTQRALLPQRKQSSSSASSKEVSEPVQNGELVNGTDSCGDASLPQTDASQPPQGKASLVEKDTISPTEDSSTLKGESSLDATIEGTKTTE